MRSQNSNLVSNYLNFQIQQFDKIYPGLKVLTSEAFETLHWRSLFVLLHLANDMSIEKLTLGDLLDAEKFFLADMMKVKELGARALGEITLKEAV